MDLACIFAGDNLGPQTRFDTDSFENSGIMFSLDYADMFEAGDVVEDIHPVGEEFGLFALRADNERPSYSRTALLCRYCWAAWVNGGLPKRGFETKDKLKAEAIVTPPAAPGHNETKNYWWPGGIERSDYDEELGNDYTRKLELIGPRLLEHRMDAASSLEDDALDEIIKNLDQYVGAVWSKSQFAAAIGDWVAWFADGGMPEDATFIVRIRRRILADPNSLSPVAFPSGCSDGCLGGTGRHLSDSGRSVWV